MSEENEIELQENPTAEPEAVVDSQPKRITRPPCQIAQAQAPVQACLRPSMWLPGARNLHSARETWKIRSDIATSIDKLVKSVENIETDEHMLVHKVNKERNFVQIYSFTEGCNWLDVVEVHFSSTDEPNVTYGEAVSFSSGLFPAWIPLSFLCNICCCCVCFSGNGMNTARLMKLRTGLQLEVEVTAETKCDCCPS